MRRTLTAALLLLCLAPLPLQAGLGHDDDWWKGDAGSAPSVPATHCVDCPSDSGSSSSSSSSGSSGPVDVSGASMRFLGGWLLDKTTTYQTGLNVGGTAPEKAKDKLTLADEAVSFTWQFTGKGRKEEIATWFMEYSHEEQTVGRADKAGHWGNHFANLYLLGGEFGLPQRNPHFDPFIQLGIGIRDGTFDPSVLYPEFKDSSTSNGPLNSMSFALMVGIGLDLRLTETLGLSLALRACNMADSYDIASGLDTKDTAQFQNTDARALVGVVFTAP